MDQPSSSKTQSHWGARILIVLMLVVVMPVGASIVYNYPPTENTFYPGCYFNRATGLHCPGCGATRCVYALLHLDFEQALAWNPLFVILLPLILYSTGRVTFQLWTGRPAPPIYWPRWGTKALLVLLLTYWIVRNIPYEPFTLLAPHKVEDAGEPEQTANVRERGGASACV